MPIFTDYKQTVDYLYAALPMFQRIGAAALKNDLTNTLLLCEELGNPQKKLRTIHIAGTNGKGSTSHFLASILQSAGYKTGLYTSPHLKEFTERIRIDGKEADHEFIIDFVNRMQPAIERIKPSFFEITVAMAFDYFVKQGVDVAVIEVGLGGRLDSTNVITPVLSLITNIGWDHTDLLGDTLEKIATEKAGIIKPGVPVVISERQPEVAKVFMEKAHALDSRIFFASDHYKISTDEGEKVSVSDGNKVLHRLLVPLKGAYQNRNLGGVLQAVEILRTSGFTIPDEALMHGIENVTRQTGLKGRWQQLGTSPLVICDTGHNKDGIRVVLDQIKTTQYEKLFMVWGMVKDKDINAVLKLLPEDAYYYFCQARIPRALPAAELAAKAAAEGLRGEVVPDVNNAINKARQSAGPHDMIFIGGSTFVVAEINDL